MSLPHDLEFCILTPPGRGAVAVVLVRGARAAQTLGEFFHGSARLAPGRFTTGRIYHGHWNNACGEEVLLCRCDPVSFEVHCHGGVAAVGQIVDDLRRQGAQRSDGGSSAAPDPHESLEQAALRTLAAARTERVANILLDQWHGALRRELQTAYEELVTANLANPLERLRKLAAQRAAGLHLTTPFTVALAGRPNVGKSSLLNALAGFERAIVFDAPGTTRDVLELETAIDGWPVQLTDMAGLRETPDPVESSGVQAAREHLQTVDLVVLVLDGSQPLTAEDHALHVQFPHALVVRNKSDLIADTPQPSAADGLCVSALGGEGIPALLEAISRRLLAHPPAAGEAVPFCQAHFQLLENVISAIEQENFTLARALLSQVLAAGASADSAPAAARAGSL